MADVRFLSAGEGTLVLYLSAQLYVVTWSAFRLDFPPPLNQVNRSLNKSRIKSLLYRIPDLEATVVGVRPDRI